jgi:hypothetical protein
VRLFAAVTAKIWRKFGENLAKNTKKLETIRRRGKKLTSIGMKLAKNYKNLAK